MKTHGPSTPQTIRGLLKRRSERAMLDARRTQEADLRSAEYVAPFGRGFHKVKNPGGATEFIVADQTGGRTFSPGSAVLLGSETGFPGEAILGGAPAGKKGGTSRTRSPRRRGTPTLEANQYAFGSDGDGNMLAMLYADASYVATRATASEVSGSYTGCVLSDSSAMIGDGSLLLRDGDTLRVWDVESEAFYSYTTSVGWLALAGPVYAAGSLYWVECEDFPNLTTVDFDLRLRKSDTDLTNVVTVRTVNLTIADAQTALGGSVIEYFQYDGTDVSRSAGIAADADGAVVYFQCRPQDGNGERTDSYRLQYRFPVNGDAPSSRAWDDPETVYFYGLALASGSFALAFWNSTPSDIYTKADEATNAAAVYWPTGSLDSYGIGSFSVGTGGQVLQVHSYGASTIARGVTSGAVITSSIEAFDEVPNYPSAMFYFGE